MAGRAQVIATHGIGERLSAALRRRRLAPDAVADRLRIAPAVLHDALARDRLPADVGSRLAAYLEVEPAWLLYGEEDFDAAVPAPTIAGRGAEPHAPTPDDDARAPEGVAGTVTDAGAPPADEDDGAADLTQSDAVARVLRALPGDDAGRVLRLAVLDALEASAREDGIALPVSVLGLRRRVRDGAL